MQRVEHHVGRGVTQLVSQIAACINFYNVKSRLAQRLGAFGA
jgi:hypothetical protein